MENTNSNEDISCDNVQNVSFDESKKLDSKENSTDTLNWTEEEEEKEVFEKSKENDSGPIFSLDSSENKTNPLKENDSEEFEWDDVDYDEGIQKDEENDSEHTFTLNKNENKVTSLNDNSWIEDSATKDSKEQEEVKKNINITPKKCWIEEDDDDDDMNFGNSKIGNKNIGSKISSNFTGGSFSLNDYQALKKNESENISEKLSTEEKRKLENVIVKTEEKKKELIEKPKTKLSQWADTEDDIKINTKEKLFEKTFLSTDSTTQNIFQVDESRVEKKPKKTLSMNNSFANDTSRDSSFLHNRSLTRTPKRREKKKNKHSKSMVDKPKCYVERVDGLAEPFNPSSEFITRKYGKEEKLPDAAIRALSEYPTNFTKSSFPRKCVRNDPPAASDIVETNCFQVEQMDAHEAELIAEFRSMEEQGTFISVDQIPDDILIQMIMLGLDLPK